MRMQHLFNELETHADTIDTGALEVNRFSALTATDCAYQSRNEQKLNSLTCFSHLKLMGLISHLQ